MSNKEDWKELEKWKESKKQEEKDKYKMDLEEAMNIMNSFLDYCGNNFNAAWNIYFLF